MPLPAGNTPWPPRELDAVTNRLAVWSAWYSGDPDMLSEIYGGLIAGDPAQPLGLGGPLDPNRPGWRGRLGATLARWFWGTATPRNERRTKLHLPVAGDIASASADLLFSEPPTITVSNEDGKNTDTQDRIEELVDDGMHADLLEAAEVCAGLGGVYLRVCWDKVTLPDRGPWLDAVDPDSAIPEWRWGVLRAVTFWQVAAKDGNTVWRHLERHEPGKILHGLYEGTDSDLGKPVPLESNDATMGLLPVVDTLVPDKLTAGYVPNMRPARVWRDVPAGAHLGRADIAGTEGLMDALDETWSSWMRDIRLAKARLLVPDVYLTSEGKGQGASWESEQEVFTTINALPQPGSSGMAILPNQFAIRVAEHQQTAQTLLEQILRSSGYSSQTYGIAQDVAVTATEVTARERRSFITRDRKIRYWRPVLADLIETLLAVDAANFGSGVEPVRPEIEFGDGVSEDMGSLAQSAQLLRAAEAASTQTLVEMVHPDWDETRVLEEVALIKDEGAMSAPGPGGGMDPLGPGAQDPNADPNADPMAVAGP